MQIEIKKAFNPIVLTIESQEDLNLFVSALTLAADNEAANENEKEFVNGVLDVLEPEAT